jgi:hypothetical protein
VPGGEVNVGYDADRFVGTPEQHADYTVSAGEFGISLSIQEYIASVTSPAGAVVVPPLLVAVSAIEAGLIPVPPDHPEITARLVGQQGAGDVGGLAVWGDRDGSGEGSRASHADVRAGLAGGGADGMAVPVS